ncbi:hypothetical protein Q3G72_033406 [Acer saccharum]|nr:hypothetical protein Q3G72_033406 [Acer saccharum]
MSGLLSLPEGCIAAVISFTSPREACHLACVSTTFRSAADSDVVWDRFLPQEYSSSWSSSSSTAWSSLSKKELYLRTRHNLIHKGKLSFWFDLSSGKKCYMIPPRELNISDVDCIYSWGWFSIPDADAYRKRRFGIPDCRFSEKKEVELGFDKMVWYVAEDMKVAMGRKEYGGELFLLGLDREATYPFQTAEEVEPGPDCSKETVYEEVVSKEWIE